MPARNTSPATARRRDAKRASDQDAARAGGEPPECPYNLGAAGASWWDWAWTTTPAKRWDDGVLYLVARRAMLEDELALLERGARSAVMAEMRALDTHLGFGPKAMKTLGWKAEREKRGDGLDEIAKRRADRLARSAGTAPLPRS